MSTSGLDQKIGELTAQQEQEMRLAQDVLHAKEDERRAAQARREAEARFMQFRAEQRDAA